MSVEDFYRPFWRHMTTIEPALVPTSHDRSYGGASILGGAVSVFGNFKREYAGRPRRNDDRWIVVSYYSYARSDPRWTRLVERVRREPPWVATSAPIFDLDIGDDDAQIIFEHRLVRLEEEAAAIPDLAAWMALAWRTLKTYAEEA